MGTGIRDMIRRYRESGLPEPIIRIDGGEWVTTIRRRASRRSETSADAHDGVHDGIREPPLTETMKRVLAALEDASEAAQVPSTLGHPRCAGSFMESMNALMKASMVEMAIPEKPRGKNRK